MAKIKICANCWKKKVFLILINPEFFILEIHYTILHKHERLEGISTPQKLINLENNKNCIYGLEVGPGVELLKISKKNVCFFIL